MIQNEIQIRQNEELSLKCQFAARHYFNRAEVYNYFIWVFAILSELTIFLPVPDDTVFLFIVFILDMLAVVFAYNMGTCLERGAKMRALFDAYVLNIGYTDYDELSLKEIKEMIFSVVEHNKKQCQIQISHNGRQNPPGVRDWYEFSHTFPDEVVQHECQRMNCWWDKKLCRIRLGVYFVVLIIFVALIFLLKDFFLAEGFFKTFLSSAALIIRILERLHANIRYYILSNEIDGALKILNAKKSQEGLIALQELINRRREMPVLQMNLIHKLSVAKFSELYEKIS